MKQLLFLAFISALIATSCNNAGSTSAEVEAIKKDSSKYTTIQWIDTSINFGSRKMGEIVTVVFKCKNTGNKPLYLYDVHPGCGCTLADYTKEPIAPGKEGEITARLDTKKTHPGEVFKTVAVSSNNRNYAPAKLKFSGIVIAADSAATAKK